MALQPISEVMQKMLKENPNVAQRLQDALKSQESKGIECITPISESCSHKLCDGSGFRWFVDYPKKINPQKFTDEIKRVQALYVTVEKQGDQNEMKRLGQVIEKLKWPAEWQEKCACYEQKEKEREIAKKLDLSGIPDKFKNAKLRDFKTDIYLEENRATAKLAKTSAVNFVTNFETMRAAGKGLYFYSDVKGSGKTRIASSIANALISVYGLNVVFIKASDISLQVRKTFNKNADTTEDEVLKVFREVDVLVIDDLAVIDKTSYTEDLLGKILDHRMDNEAVTIITSNKKIDDLETFYPKEIVASRVRKLCYEIIMPEESIRDEEAKQENEALELLLFGKRD